MFVTVSYESFTREAGARFGRYSRGNRGELGDAIEDHANEVAAWQRDPLTAPRLMEGLLETASNPMMLMEAWNTLSACGGKASGPDGLQYSDFDQPSLLWEYLRDISTEIRAGRFRRGKVRKVRVPKPGKQDHRVIHVANICTRTVSRAVLETVQPILDPSFMPLSVGFRPRRNRLHGLAAADLLVREQGLTQWLVFDLRNAFDVVPRQRLMDLVAKRLSQSPICTLIAELIRGKGKRGIPQGSCISSLLLNLYVDHLFDRKWTHRSGCPCIRYADDFVVLCPFTTHSQQTFNEAITLLQVAGFHVKESYATAFCNLATGDTAEWLGFQVTLAPDGGLQFGLAEKSWWRLDERLSQCLAKQQSQEHATSISRGWLAAMAIAIDQTQLPPVVQRIESTAQQYGFDGLALEALALPTWHRAQETWQRARQEVQSWFSDPAITI